MDVSRFISDSGTQTVNQVCGILFSCWVMLTIVTVQIVSSYLMGFHGAHGGKGQRGSIRLPDGTSQGIRRQSAAAIIWEYKGKWEIQCENMSVISHVAADIIIMIYFFPT